MQFFGTITPIMIKASNLVQIRVILFGSIIDLGAF